ncbi:MAG: hypothetical protein ACYCS7_02680 [Acidimicrobiales bacterium]
MSVPVRQAVVAALPAWLVARAVVIGSLLLAHYIVSHTHPGAPGVAIRAHEGLLGWDAGYYRDIARAGYAPLGHQALRFFPLVPALARVLTDITGVSVSITLLVISNLSALGVGAGIYALVRTEGEGDGLARRAAWLVALAPPAFVLVMGYSDSTFVLLAIIAFFGYRRGHWGLAMGMGVLAGLSRPVAILLCLPAAVEAWRGWRGARAGGRLARLGATAAPAVGIGLYLGWAQWRFDAGLAPIRDQTASNLRGGLANPLHTLAHDVRDLVHHHVGSGLHVPWFVLCVVLLVVCFRRLPSSYGFFAAGMLGLAVSSANLDSLERYCLTAFPFIIAGATLMTSERVEKAVLALSAAGMAGYSLLAFLNAYVP